MCIILYTCTMISLSYMYVQCIMCYECAIIVKVGLLIVNFYEPLQVILMVLVQL